MALEITWITGDGQPTATYPVGGVGSYLMVAQSPNSDPVENVQFVEATGGPLLNLPTTRVPMDPTTRMCTAQITVPIGTTDGETAKITATPYDAAGQPGTPIDLELTFYEYDSNSGAYLYDDGDFILSPSDLYTAGRYIHAYMIARKKKDGAPIPGAMVSFAVKPAIPDFEIYNDPPQNNQVSPYGQNYYVKTDANGRGAVRIVTHPGRIDRTLELQAWMMGVNLQRGYSYYFGNNNDTAQDEFEVQWSAPYAITEPDGNILIPDNGKTFTLYVSVNGENEADYNRFVLMNNSTALPYLSNQDGTMQIPYSVLVQSTDISSNQFSYVRQQSDGNVKCSRPWECGVDGSRDNLPDPTQQPRVAPAPTVVPDPGPSRLINIGTIDTYMSLRLALQNFQGSLLPGLDLGQSKSLTAVFYFYMNGYNYDGSVRPSRIFSSADAQSRVTAPTAKYDHTTGEVTFSELWVALAYGNTTKWGRDKYTGDKKRVGFEYTLSDGNTTWYSLYDGTANSYYFIDTGNW